MKLNFRPQRVAFIDFETQSNCELTTTHKYSRHPSTRVLTAVVKTDDGDLYRMGPYLTDVDKRTLVAIGQAYTMVAHNARFDASVWEDVAGLPEVEWFDTLPAARYAALPGKLEELGQRLVGSGKDKNGKRLLDMLCILKPGQKPPAVGPAHQLLLDYNARDVELLELIYSHVKDFVEPDVMTADRVVNDRGIPVAKWYMEAMAELYDKNTKRVKAELLAQIGDVNPSSPKQMVEWLKQQGFNVPNINKATYKTLMEKPDEFFVGDEDMDAPLHLITEVLQLRSEVVRVGRSKIDSAIDATDDDLRIREQLVYYGAHTGRWSARKLQPHNMPSMVHLHPGAMMAIANEPTLANVEGAVEESIKKTGLQISTSDVLNGSLRHIIRSDEDLLYADYNAVELRGTAWFADEHRMLELLNSGQSVYLDTGRRIFNRPVTKKDEVYGFCKQLVLGCTYGMSGAKFEAVCKSRNVKTKTLQEAGISVQESVKLFRQSYPAIPALWKSYGNATFLAVRGVPNEAGKCKFYMKGPHLNIQLPSGRCLIYRNARIEKLVPGYAMLYGSAEPVDTVVFDKPTGGRRGFLYGSRVCENVVQATCRDFLATALVRAEQVGLNPVLHVHDELVCEAPRSKLKELCILMSDPPAWAKGFPLLVEGQAGPIWSKYTESYDKCDAMGGIVK